jgi:dCTP deaminase
MILTGKEIYKELKNNNIVIKPFDANLLEPNSYGFRLANTFLLFERDTVFDVDKPAPHEKITVGEEGLLLEPNRFYLGSTYETIGSKKYAKTLYARHSVAAFGMWIQFSAPLGHTGAIINWTLEIRVCAPVLIYPYMVIGKVAFWKNYGKIVQYEGKYTASQMALASRMYEERPKVQLKVKGKES